MKNYAILCRRVARPLRVLLLVSMVMAAWPVLAAEPPGGERRPRIGVALSGGGARGCAHVGVLKVLEELRVPVDYVAGTSMGAVVGGFYATGISAAEMEQILTSLDWVDLMEDEQPRRDRAYRRKQDDQRYLMNLEIGLNGFRLPTGLKSGQKLTFELRRHTLAVARIRDFAKLPIPFSAVATDLETGETVVLDRGNLAQAVRASMSIPGVFTPVELHGRLLVDGGLVNNLPIDVVRDMGAEIVIAVDIGQPLVGRDKLGSLFAVTSQALGVSSRRSVEAQLPAADLIITPELSGHGTLDFSDVAAIVGAGEQEARRHRAWLQELAVSAEEYARYRERKKLPRAEPQPVTVVSLPGLRRVDERVIKRLIRTRTGEPLDLEILRRDLARIHGLGDFELVDFDLVPEAAGVGVVIRAKEKVGGPFFMHTALKFEADEDQNTATSFLINLTATRLNPLGAEWRTDLTVGRQQSLESELYQPLDFGSRWFLAPRLIQQRDLVTLFTENQRYAELEQWTTLASLELGLTFGTWGEARLGVYRARIEQTLDAGPQNLETTIDTGGWSAILAVDRLDSIYFPRRGQLGLAVVRLARPSLGAESRYEQFQLNHLGAASRGRHTFLSSLELGFSQGSDLPAYAQFGGGGLFSFSAYERGELSGSHFAVFRPTYFYRLTSLPAAVGKGVYLGGWIEVGNYWQSKDEVGFDDLRYAATLALGAETVIGPVYLAVGLAERGRQGIYLSIGPR